MNFAQALLACPICKEHMQINKCRNCGLDFGVEGASFICREMYESDADFAEAMEVIDFWGNGWKKRLQEPEHEFIYRLGPMELQTYAAKALAWHRKHETLLGREVPARHPAGSIALNIGCGAGDEAIILGSQGAKCIAMDITVPAAAATDSLLRRLDWGVGIQGDARFLPLGSNSVDLVYSSGVLHHSPDIFKSISEIHRVLKPGGVAYVMLYARWSIVFMQEKAMRWSGERAWETEGRTNPCTTVYSVNQCERLFAAFQNVNVSKRGASLKQIAKIGQYLPTRFDSSIDPLLGSNLNITATKAR
jgi:ubiquinone/menaquinone biosynthesis C-methylase UbiE